MIEEHLRAAKAVVVIWSNEAVKSQWVRAEANRGREQDKLVQLVIDDAALPLPFDQIQCANLVGWTGDLHAPGWKKVIASIVDLTGGPGVSMVQSVQPTVRKNSICVLRFVNMSGDAEQESYFLLKDPDIVARLRNDPHGFLDSVTTPAIFDEVQHVPEIFAYVRSRIDRRPRRVGQWIPTGSQEAPLMRNVTESMAGAPRCRHISRTWANDW